MDLKPNQHLCNLCEKGFATKGSLKYHETTFHDMRKKRYNKGYKRKKISNSINCKLCYKMCISAKLLKHHIDTAHKKDKKYLEMPISELDLQFKCTECHLMFLNQSLLDYHQKVHLDEKMSFLKEPCTDVQGFKCILCYSSIKSFSNLCKHVISYHSKDLDHFKNIPQPSDLLVHCDECELRFVTTDASIYHRIKVHYPVDNLQCQLCDKAFKNMGNAYSHRYRFHKNELVAFKKDFKSNQKQYSCNLCGKAFATNGSLKYHNVAIHDVRIKEDKKIRVKQAFLQKKQKIVTDNISYNCNFCSQVLEGRGNLIEHCEVVHDKRDEKVGDDLLKCMVCSKVVKTSSIRDHRKTHNEGLSYQCNLCHEKFKLLSYLKRHSKSVHESKCTECPMQFVNDMCLKRHCSKIHKSKAKVSSIQSTNYCNLCYVKFDRQSYLKNHQDKIHTEPEEAFYTSTSQEIKHSLLKIDCSLCDKKFISKNALKYHRQHSHKAERKDDNSEICCEFCNQVFKWKNRRNLRTHMKSVHRVDDYDIAEHLIESPQLNTVQNFMDILNSL